MKNTSQSKSIETALTNAAEKERDRLLAMVAHELRTPLGPIVNGALVLQRRGIDPELVHATARIIERQGRLLGRLIDDLLDISHAQLGAVHLQCGRVSMSSIVDTCMQTTSVYVGERGQRLQVEVSPESMELHADSARLCQALQNLIVNAAKFSERGGLIRVRAGRDRDDAVVVVSDDGMGIEASELESIFTLYRQVEAKGSRRDGGLGIGLYLARRFAQAHGGTLVAASAGVNRGATFTLRIPCLAFYSEGAGISQWEPSSRSVSALTTA